MAMSITRNMTTKLMVLGGGATIVHPLRNIINCVIIRTCCLIV